MSELNYVRIAHILGGTLTEVENPVFGGFSAPRSAVERYRSVQETHRRVHLSPEDMGSIARAFEEVREGFEPDRVLVDAKLFSELIERSRFYGVKASPTVIAKKLQALRKSGRYGIKLKKTTRAAELDADPYFYIAELAFTQVRFRQAVTEDDVITDTRIGKEFEMAAMAIAPTAPLLEVKWALLCLRKARYFSPEKAEKLLALRPATLTNQLQRVGNLHEFHDSDVPEDEGVFAFHESNKQDRYLYIGASKNLREAVAPFHEARPFIAVSGVFWKPRPLHIGLELAVLSSKYRGASARDWGFRLIQRFKPLFNMPVQIEDQAA